MAGWHVGMDSSRTGEPSCGVERQQEALFRKEEEFNNRLADFPHSFQLKNHNALTRAALRSTKNHLEAALETDLSKTKMEIAAMHNLLAFVLSRLDMQEQADGELNKALLLPGQDENIVSLADKAVILWQMKRERESESFIRRLLDLKQKARFRDLVIKAKAELASSYLRLGRKYIKFAITGFREVIPLASEPEKSLWKFGLAVAYRQSIDLQSLPNLQDQTETSVREEALKLLLEVVDTTPSQNLMANASAEIGLLIHMGAWDKETEQKLCSMAKTTCVQSIKKALRLDPNDPSVMVKGGRLFRYKKDLQSSLKNLKKAVERQKSSSAYHHLGLTFKAMATNNVYGRPAVKRGGKRHQRKKRSMVMKKGANRSQNETRDSTPHTGEPMAIASTANDNEGDGNVEIGETTGTKKHAEHTEEPMAVASAANENEKEGNVERGETTGTQEYAEHCGLDSGFCSRDTSLWSEARASDEPMDWQDEEEENHVQNDLVIDGEELEKTDTHQGDDAGATKNAKTLRKLMKAIKSPPSKKMTSLDKDNPLVVEAIKNLQAAIDFSEEENTRAMYDLGLLYKACGMKDEAWDLFSRIHRKENSSAGPLDVIGAYEQSGFIRIEQSEMTVDETERQEKLKDAEYLLNLALSASTNYYSKLPLVGHDIHRVWRSLAYLLKLVEENDSKDRTQKLKDKLNVLKMVKNPGKTLPLVRKLEPLADEMKDDEGLMLCVNSYANMGKYEAAINTMDLMSISPSVEIRQKIYIKAAKQKLLESTETAHTVARKHFAAAFRETFVQRDTAGASGTDTTSSDEEAPEDHWDVMLLHDEDATSATSKLNEVLTEVCALKVTTMEEDVRLGRITTDDVVRNIKRSKVSVVVLGSGQSIPKLLRMYFTFAARRPSACVLTLHDSCHIPNQLKPLEAERIHITPLMNVGQPPAAVFNQETASAITELFYFIVRSS